MSVTEKVRATDRPNTKSVLGLMIHCQVCWSASRLRISKYKIGIIDNKAIRILGTVIHFGMDIKLFKPYETVLIEN